MDSYRLTKGSGDRLQIYSGESMLNFSFLIYVTKCFLKLNLYLKFGEQRLCISRPINGIGFFMSNMSGRRQ